jgi:hypothetical protein
VFSSAHLSVGEQSALRGGDWNDVLVSLAKSRSELRRNRRGLAELAPTRMPARFAVILFACVLTLYITIGFQGSDPAWVYTFRSIPAFILPGFIVAVSFFSLQAGARAEIPRSVK